MTAPGPCPRALACRVRGHLVAAARLVCKDPKCARCDADAREWADAVLAEAAMDDETARRAEGGHDATL